MSAIKLWHRNEFCIKICRSKPKDKIRAPALRYELALLRNPNISQFQQHSHERETPFYWWWFCDEYFTRYFTISLFSSRWDAEREKGKADRYTSITLYAYFYYFQFSSRRRMRSLFVNVVMKSEGIKSGWNLGRTFQCIKAKVSHSKYCGTWLWFFFYKNCYGLRQ